MAPIAGERAESAIGAPRPCPAQHMHLCTFSALPTILLLWLPQKNPQSSPPNTHILRNQAHPSAVPPFLAATPLYSSPPVSSHPHWTHLHQGPLPIKHRHKGLNLEVTLLCLDLDFEQAGGAWGLWPQKGEAWSMSSWCPSLNDLAPAWTHWVPGYAVQAHLARADEIVGSFGLQG